MFSVYVFNTKAAVTDLFESIVTVVEAAVPEASPDQLLKLYPVDGAAVRVTTWPCV
jgi:hypothetical protein